MADVKVDLSEVKNIRKEVRAAMVVALGRLGERGYQLLRKEVPYQTGNLKQGVAPADIDESKLTATLVVSARSARVSGGSGTLHLPSGKTKTVKLKPVIQYNYAEVVALGNLNDPVKPKKAKAMLIPVSSAPTDESYITSGSQMFVVRMSRKGKAPNRYDERAATQLENDSPNIVGEVFGELFN